MAYSCCLNCIKNLSLLKVVAEAMVDTREPLLPSADRVTFTVQKGVEIEPGNPPVTDDIEEQWLCMFQSNLLGAQEKIGVKGSTAAHNGIQALYHSSALPLPYSKRSSLSEHRRSLNGLVGACLTAFTEVRHSLLLPLPA